MSSFEENPMLTRTGSDDVGRTGSDDVGRTSSEVSVGRTLSE